MYIFLAGYSALATHSFAYGAHFVFLGDVWNRTQRAALASGCATNLATHLPKLATHLPNLATHLPDIATHLPIQIVDILAVQVLKA